MAPTATAEVCTPLMTAETPLVEYIAHWLPIARLSLYGPTCDNYARYLRLHCGELHARPIGEIRMPEVRRLLIALKVRYPRAGVPRNVYVALSSCFRLAMDEGLIQINPAAGAIRTIMGKRRDKIRCDGKGMTAEELDAFLAVTEREGEPLLRDILMTVAGVGLRLGEALGLRPEDLDVERCVIRIERSWSSRMIGPPKGRRTRTVHAPRELIARLVQRIDTLAPGEEWLFPSPRKRCLGLPVQNDYVERGMKRLCQAACLPRHYTPHCLRHTWTVLALERTGNLLYCARQLGHSSIAITCDLYGVAADPKEPEVVGFFDTMLNRQRLREAPAAFKAIRPLYAPVPMGRLKSVAERERTRIPPGQRSRTGARPDGVWARRTPGMHMPLPLQTGPASDCRPSTSASDESAE